MHTVDEKPTYVSVSRLSFLYNVKESTIRYFIKTGRLPAKRLGRQYLIAENDFVNAFESVGKDDGKY